MDSKIRHAAPFGTLDTPKLKGYRASATRFMDNVLGLGKQ